MGNLNTIRVLDPLVFGDYPAEMRLYLGSELPQFSKEEIEYVKGSIDFIGLNHYTTLYSEDCIYSNCTEGADHAIKGYQQRKTDRDGIRIGEPVCVGVDKNIRLCIQKYI